MDLAKSDYEKLKKVVDTLRTSEVCFSYRLSSSFAWFISFKTIYLMVQVDAEYKLQDKKKACKELEIKGKGFKKKLDDLQATLLKHMEQ